MMVLAASSVPGAGCRAGVSRAQCTFCTDSPGKGRGTLIQGGSTDCTRQLLPDTMGIEKEKADARIFMDQDEFNRSGMPILTEKSYDADHQERDPRSLNTHLKLGFEDVIAEPDTTHSFDKVWICSTALYEVSRYLIYKVLTVFLAIPLAFVFGLLFAILSCLHIWFAMPFVRTCLMVLPAVQTIWKGITDSLIAPLFASMGKMFSSVSVRIDNS